MRVRVGDIELENSAGGGSVQFGTRSSATLDPSKPSVTPTESRPPPSEVLAPFTAGVWVGFGFVSAIALAVFGAAAILWDSPLRVLALAGAATAVPMTLGAFFLAGRRRRLDSRSTSQSRALADARRGRLLEALRGAASPLSFEELRDRLQWTDEALARTLAPLVSEGGVIEDICSESSEWTYELSASCLLGSDLDSAPPLTAS